MAVRVIDRREAYDSLRSTLFGGGPTQVLVGIQEEDGKAPHGDRGATLLQVAIWNEFGTKYIPERPYLRGWFDKNKAVVEAWLVALMPSVISGKRTVAQVLDILGLKIVGAIQKTMTGPGIPPPNAPSTIAKKGSETATVEDGTLRSKITHVVKVKE